LSLAITGGLPNDSKSGFFYIFGENIYKNCALLKQTRMSFEVFRKFPLLDEAISLTDLLKENNIPYTLEDYSKQADITFFGQNLDAKIIVRAKITDFPKIEDLIDKNTNITLKQVDKEHYLFEFSDDELTEIIVKPNEWSNYDYKVAELLLKDRGVNISPRFIESIKKQRYNELQEKDSYSPTWIVVGYITAFLGGLLGFAIGLSLWFMKRKLPNGDKVFIYNDSDRLHGKRITILGLMMLLIYIGLKIYLDMK